MPPKLIFFLKRNEFQYSVSGVFVHLFDADIFLPFTFSAIHLAASSVNIHLALSAQGSLDTLKKNNNNIKTW